MDSYQWKTAPFSWELAESIAGDLNLPLLIGIILARRGFASVEEARAFLEVDERVPNPFLFRDMEEAVQLLEDALRTGRRVVIHGDYDVDGISATALLVVGLRELGLQPEWYLPSRFVEGYGLSRTAVEEIARGRDGLLVTVDCGINYPEEVALARASGLDVIVTDHHQVGPDVPLGPCLHPAFGLYPHDHLAGVGLALKLLHALHHVRHNASLDRLPAALQEHLDLVALGTIADLVPLLGENRYYVKEGLMRIGWGQRPGIAALARVAGAAGRIDTDIVSFRLAPRLNAAGRLQDPQCPLRLLLCPSVEEADDLAKELDLLNRERQEIEARTFAEAVEQVDALAELPPILVLAGEWHEGVIGIVASRLVERFHRPTILLAVRDGVAKGSGRSIPTYDLVSGLSTCTHLLTVFGGHSQAAGLSLPADAVPAFVQSITAHARLHLDAAALFRTYAPDAVIQGDDLTLDTAEALARLAPFGIGNPPVQLLAVSARVERPELTRDGKHLRCSVVVDGVQARGIGFGFGEKLPALQEHGPCFDAGLRLTVGEWQGVSRPEVRLHSLYRLQGRAPVALRCDPTCPFLDDLLTSAPGNDRADPCGQHRDIPASKVRDLRNRGGRLSAVAQVLSSGEPTAILTTSVPRRLGRLAASLPLESFGIARVGCLSRLCWRTRTFEHEEQTLLFLDWAAAERRASLLYDRRHILVVDPPFAVSCTRLLADLGNRGALVHLCYGPEERQFTAEFLRRMLHPRYWMVHLYRAWRDGHTADEAMRAAARAGWEADSLLPSGEDLARATAVLHEIGLAPGSPGEAKMNLDEAATYLAAQQTYEEAVRLCWTL